MTLYVGMTLVVHVHLALSSLLVLASIPDDYHNYYQGNTVCGMSPLNKLQNQSYLPVARSAPYILNGQDSYSGQWPFYAWLSINGDLRCGAVIVKSDMVLTAGRCVRRYGLPNPERRYKIKRNDKPIFIYVGKVDRSEKSRFQVRHEIDAVQVGAYYKSRGFTEQIADFARVWLRKPIRFNSHVQPICIPSRPEIVNYLAEGRCYVIGSGALSEYPFVARPNRLQWLEMKQRKSIITPSLPSGENATYRHFHSHDGKNRQICGWDEGAPLVALDHNKRWSLLGIGLDADNICNSKSDASLDSKFTMMAKILGIFDENFKEPGPDAD